MPAQSPTEGRGKGTSSLGHLAAAPEATVRATWLHSTLGAATPALLLTTDYWLLTTEH